MTVFVLRKKGGYFAAKARVKAKNFEVFGVRKTFTEVQESGVLPGLRLKATKMWAGALPLSIPGPLPNLKKSLLNATTGREGSLHICLQGAC
jgi:hypothetical protein